MIFLNKDERIEEPSAVTVGMFDGLHLGHRKLIEKLKNSAAGLKTMIFTFEVSDQANSIYTEYEKKCLLKQTGVDYAYLQEGTMEFYSTPKDDFLNMLKTRYNTKVLAVGQDFRFGRGAQGDADYLLQNAGKLGLKVQVVPHVLWEEEKVSSTRIRKLIACGDVRQAARMLGGYYFASGNVQKGNRIGSAIDFPTININTPKLKPANGVYATLTQINEKIYKSVTNVGVRPTVSQKGQVNIETNIFDFNYKIYDMDVTVYFVERIREEIKFAGLNELKSQIARDKEAALELLKPPHVVLGLSEVLK